MKRFRFKKGFLTPYTGVSLNGGIPNLHPKTISFRKTRGFVGETHHFRNPPILTTQQKSQSPRHLGKSWQTGATSWPGRVMEKHSLKHQVCPLKIDAWKSWKNDSYLSFWGVSPIFSGAKFSVSRECNGSEVLPTCWVSNWVFISSGGEFLGESHQIINKGSHQQAIIFRGVHQLRLVVSPSIYHGFSTIQTVVVWDFWTINSIARSSFSQANWMKATFEKIPFV